MPVVFNFPLFLSTKGPKCKKGEFLCKGSKDNCKISSMICDGFTDCFAATSEEEDGNCNFSEEILFDDKNTNRIYLHDFYNGVRGHTNLLFFA